MNVSRSSLRGDCCRNNALCICTEGYVVCFFQDWQERYIHENYTRIMKDKLIETVSCNTRPTHYNHCLQCFLLRVFQLEPNWTFTFLCLFLMKSGVNGYRETILTNPFVETYFFRILKETRPIEKCNTDWLFDIKFSVKQVMENY